MLSNMSVKARLGLLVGLLSVIMLILGVIGLTSTARVGARLKTVYEDRTVPVVQLNVILDNLHRARGRILSAALADDAGKAAQETAQIPDFMANIDKQWSAYMATYLTDEEKGLAAGFAGTYQAYHDAMDKVRPVAAAGERAKTMEVMAQTGFRRSFDACRDALQKLVDLQARVGKAEYEGGVADYNLAHKLSIASIILGLLCGIGLAWWIIRSITQPLGRAVESAQRIASGDLSGRIENGSKDEVGRLLDALTYMQNELKQVAGQIKRGADELSLSAAALASSSSDVAKASDIQSEASSAIAAAVEEMTVSIGHINDHAGETRRISGEAGQLSEHGAHVTHKATTNMRGIADTVGTSLGQVEDLSQKIDRVSGIVEVIKGIADQTNLLALNAAIEAARAGEHGRGFAVVADEVRSLSERTARSTQEIAGMIQQILDGAAGTVSSMQTVVSEVGSGVELSNEAGDVIRQINERMRDVVQAVADISAALREQSTASSDIAKQIECIAQSTEENTTAISAAADSSRRVNDLGQGLLQSVARFKLE